VSIWVGRRETTKTTDVVAFQSQLPYEAQPGIEGLQALRLSPVRQAGFNFQYKPTSFWVQVAEKLGNNALEYSIADGGRCVRGFTERVYDLLKNTHFDFIHAGGVG
jgi:hypothetical protein